MSTTDPHAHLDRIEQAAQVLWEDKRNNQSERTFNYRTQGATIMAEVRALRALLSRSTRPSPPPPQNTANTLHLTRQVPDPDELISRQREI